LKTSSLFTRRSINCFFRTKIFAQSVVLRRIGGRGHFRKFRSRDKDDGHTIRSAISENPLLYANFATLSFIDPELLLTYLLTYCRLKFYIAGIGNFAHHCHYHYRFLLLSLGCHPLEGVTPHLLYLSDLVSPLFFVNLPTIFFPSGVTPWRVSPGAVSLPPPP